MFLWSIPLRLHTHLCLSFYAYLWADAVHAMIFSYRAVWATSAAILAFEIMPFMIQYDYCAPWSHHHHVAMILAYAPYLWANVHAMTALCTRAVPATSAAILAFESMLQQSNTQFNMYTNKGSNRTHSNNPSMCFIFSFSHAIDVLETDSTPSSLLCPCPTVTCGCVSDNLVSALKGCNECRYLVSACIVCAALGTIQCCSWTCALSLHVFFALLWKWKWCYLHDSVSLLNMCLVSACVIIASLETKMILSPWFSVVPKHVPCCCHK